MERKLARAFAEAREESAFLIIDEAGGLLRTRSGASRPWEASMVNELLVQMENHALPIVCITNHLDCIDPAALRRFAFEVKFDFLSPAQSEAAYRRYIAAEPPPGLRALQHLTPGDFAVVAKRLQIMRGIDAPPHALRLLAQEVETKNLRPMKMGF